MSDIRVGFRWQALDTAYDGQVEGYCFSGQSSVINEPIMTGYRHQYTALKLTWLAHDNLPQLGNVDPAAEHNNCTWHDCM